MGFSVVFRIDIKGEDSDGQSVTYKVAYKIIIPRTTLDILNGNTYYVDLGDNNYTKVTYDDSGFTTESYSNTELINGSTETTAITYTEDAIKFVNDGKNIICVVKETPTLNLTCTAEGEAGELKVNYLDAAPKFVAPASYTLKATAANTQNNTDTFAPKIASFSVTGNAPSENDKVIISKSKMGGKFSYSVTMEDEYNAKALLSGLDDGNKSIISPYDITKDKTVNFNCTFDNDNGTDSGINYTCEALSLKNTEGNADTKFGMYVCNDSNLSKSNIKCSKAEVPVLFVD